MHSGCGEGLVKSLVIVDDEIISVHQDSKIKVWRRFNRKFKNITCSSLYMKDHFYNLMPPPNNYVHINVLLEQQCFSKTFRNNFKKIKINGRLLNFIIKTENFKEELHVVLGNLLKVQTMALLLISKQNTNMKTLTKASKQKNINEKIIYKKKGKVHIVFSCENKLKVIK